MTAIITQSESISESILISSFKGIMSISSTIVLSVLCHRVSVCYDMQNQLKLIDFIAY